MSASPTFCWKCCSRLSASLQIPSMYYAQCCVRYPRAKSQCVHAITISQQVVGSWGKLSARGPSITFRNTLGYRRTRDALIGHQKIFGCSPERGFKGGLKGPPSGLRIFQHTSNWPISLQFTVYYAIASSEVPTLAFAHSQLFLLLVTKLSLTSSLTSTLAEHLRQSSHFAHII
jgi:hypothetical protein